MTPATIISRTAKSTTFIHSDVVAARMMQQALSDGRASVDDGAIRIAPTGEVHGGAERRAGKREFTDRQAALRTQVDDVVRAMARLRDVMAGLDGISPLVVESDTVTGVAFADHFLAQMAARTDDRFQMLLEEAIATIAQDDAEDEAAPQDDSSVIRLDGGVVKIHDVSHDRRFAVPEGAHIAIESVCPLKRGVAGGRAALWDGNDLRLTFVDGSGLTLTGAPDAGSVVLRSNADIVTLMPPKVPAKSGVLDAMI